MMNRTPEHYDNWQRELFENLPSEWKLAKAQFLVQRQVRDVLETDDVVTVFRDGEVTLRTNRRTDGFTFADKEIGYHHVEPGDLAIHKMDGGFGAIGISDSAGKVSPVVNLYRSDNFDLRFVSYFLRTAVAAGYVKSLQKGIRERSIEFDHAQFSDFYLPLPNLDTQRRIADYLDKETAQIDTLVEELDGYVELLEKRRSEAFSSQFASYSSSTPIYAHFSLVNGDRGESYPKAHEIQTSGIPFVNAGDISELRVSTQNMKYVSTEKYETMGGAKLQIDDVIFCLRGTIGKHGIIDFNEGALASSVCVLRNHKIQTYLPELLNFAMELPQFKQSLKFAENGSAQPNLSGESLLRCRIPSVPQADQSQLVSKLKRETAKTDTMITQCRELKELLLKRRQVLITDVVTGKVEV